MTYGDWLDIIEKLKSKDQNILLLEQMEKEPINENIHINIAKRLAELISIRTENLVKDCIANLEIIFNDPNELDLYMVRLKKEASFIERLSSIQQLNTEEQKTIKATVHEKIDSTYDILTKESIMFDDTGALQLIIKNNRIKWSE